LWEEGPRAGSGLSTSYRISKLRIPVKMASRPGNARSSSAFTNRSGKSHPGSNSHNAAKAGFTLCTAPARNLAVTRQSLGVAPTPCGRSSPISHRSSRRADRLTIRDHAACQGQQSAFGGGLRWAAVCSRLLWRWQHRARQSFRSRVAPRPVASSGHSCRFLLRGERG
jgi:hypothetical protein